MRRFVHQFLPALFGRVMRRSSGTREELHTALNGLIARLTLPAMILSQVHGIRLEPDILCSVSFPLLLFLIGVTSVTLIVVALSLVPDLISGVLLVGGLANSAFIGLPVIAAFDRTSEQAAGILADQLGLWLVLSTLALTVAHVRAGKQSRTGVILRRVIKFPPLIALVVALALNGVLYPAWIAASLAFLGAMVAPLALLSLGLRLRLSDLQGLKLPVALAICLKLIASAGALTVA